MSVTAEQAQAAEPVYLLLTKAHFEPLLNTAFRTGNTTPEVELILTEVRELRAYPGPGREDPFALMFRGPADKALPQAIYQLMAQGDQVFDVFLVPVGLDAAGRLYEAVFN